MFLTGFLVSLLGAGWGYARQSLSGSGAIGAVLVGTLITGFGGWVWLGILVVFFGSSSFFSHYRRQDKQEVEQDFAKTGRRDIWQVAANGGLGVLLAVFSFQSESAGLLFIGYMGAMAAVTADTWATELGVLSRGTTRSILTWKKVAPGTSGGVTLQGTLAGAAGAFLIALTAAVGEHLIGPGEIGVGVLLGAGLLGGMVGCYMDSLLGASLQVRYCCRVCGRTTEKTRHCHQLTRKAGGWDWVNNDLVNFLSSGAGGLAAALLGYWGLG